jgi:hypothetical protein
LTAHELPLGWVFALPTTSSAALYVQYYAFRTQNADTFKMVLKPSDGRWFETHRDQLEAYWDDAAPWTVPTA